MSNEQRDLIIEDIITEYCEDNNIDPDNFYMPEHEGAIRQRIDEAAILYK